LKGEKRKTMEIIADFFILRSFFVLVGCLNRTSAGSVNGIHGIKGLSRMIQIEKIQVNPLILRIRVQTTLNQDGQDS
jgi:hypothetical protein